MPAPTATITTTTTPNTPSITFLSLPVEIRLQIYTHILTTSNIHSFRPQRKIGWNRPHADLTNPALLFESDAHISLKHLFHSKLTKGDHHLILETVLHHAKILVVDHADFTALLKIAGLPLVSQPAGSGVSSSSSTSPSSSSNQTKSLASVVRNHLRTIDFSDRMDEIICQPNDIVKLVKGLPGLRSICLTSRHVQRYSGTVEEHIEFTRERAEREVMAISTSAPASQTSSSDTTPAETASELRRLTLRSPMTDGNRMMISPALFNRSLSLSLPTSPNSNSTNSKTQKPTWVVVDLSLLIWQHFLYNGAPYRDHWRTIKMTTLLEVAGKRNVDVVMGLRNVEFDPSVRVKQEGGRQGRGRGSGRLDGGVFRGEMSSRDWVLRLRRVGGGRVSGGNGGGGVGTEYCVRQRRAFDEIIGQEGCGVLVADKGR